MMGGFWLYRYQDIKIYLMFTELLHIFSIRNVSLILKIEIFFIPKKEKGKMLTKIAFYNDFLFFFRYTFC